MVIWTPEEWGIELDEFAAAVREKKFNKISYDSWKMIYKWRTLPSIASICLNIDNDFICILNEKLDYFTFEKEENYPFIEYLKSKYCAILSYAVSCSRCPISNLTQFRSITDMPYTVNYSPSPYSVTTTSDVISNYNLLTNMSFNKEYDAIWQDNKKEKKDMNFFKNFEFGPVKNDTVRLSPYGLAVKNLDGSWVSYDSASDSIIDVDVFNFEGKNLIYKIPAAPHTVRAGDMIVHQGKGMYVVADVCEGDTCVSVIDPRAGESKEILFTKSPFGFTFIVKLVSLLDMSGIEANPDNPFGNLLPLAMMGDKDCDAAAMMAMMMMMNSEGCNFDMSNPMMMYALMSGENKDMLLPMMLMANRK